MIPVVHDAVRAILGEDDQVHAGQADAQAIDHPANILGIIEDFFLGVQLVYAAHAHCHALRVPPRGVTTALKIEDFPMARLT